MYSYIKTLVMHAKFLVVAHNVFCKRYVGGNGHAVYDASDPNDLDEVKSGPDSGVMSKSIFVLPTLALWEAPKSMFDISGQLHRDLAAQASVSESIVDMCPPGIKACAAVWGFTPFVNALEKDYFADIKARYNTIVHQDYQRNYKTHGIDKGDWTDHTYSKTHWGSRVYTGCGEVRNGKSMYLQEPTYKETKTMAIGY